MEVQLAIPWPPSANHIWQSTRNVTYLSKPYKEFLNSAVAAIISQNTVPEPIAKPVRVEILLHPPTRRRIDIDNRIKPTLDALTKAGVWRDDSQVNELTVRRSDVIKGGLAIVFIWVLDKE